MSADPYNVQRPPQVRDDDISTVPPRKFIQPPAQISECEQIADTLADHNVFAPPEAIVAVQAVTHEHAVTMASQWLKSMLLGFPQIPSVVALRLYIEGRQQSYREAAKEAGCSHQAVAKQLKQLRKLPPAH